LNPARINGDFPLPDFCRSISPDFKAFFFSCLTGLSPEWFFESLVPCVKSDYFVTNFIFLLCGNPYRSAGFVYTYQTRFIMSSINQH